MRYGSDLTSPKTAALIDFLGFQIYNRPLNYRELDFVSRPNTAFYGVQEERLVAGAVLSFTHQPEIELQYMAVEKDCRGRKLGGALLQAMERAAVDLGASSVRVFPLYDKSYDFFAGNGYTPHLDPDFNGYVAKDLFPPDIAARRAGLSV